MRWLNVLVLGLVVSHVVLGCDGQVEMDPTSTGAGGGSTSNSASSSSTSSGGCSGSAAFCASDCGSDYFPFQQVCEDGSWVCPPGSVDPADCPPGTCWGAPLSCEVCGSSGWGCAPDESCTAGCGGLVCVACPESGSYFNGPCACECSVGGFECAIFPGCCLSDSDCSGYARCVGDVCKEPAPTGCWDDFDCGPDMVCVGASICPCLYDCDGLDAPGSCVPTGQGGM